MKLDQLRLVSSVKDDPVERFFLGFCQGTATFEFVTIWRYLLAVELDQPHLQMPRGLPSRQSHMKAAEDDPVVTALWLGKLPAMYVGVICATPPVFKGVQMSSSSLSSIIALAISVSASKVAGSISNVPK